MNALIESIHPNLSAAMILQICGCFFQIFPVNFKKFQKMISSSPYLVLKQNTTLDLKSIAPKLRITLLLALVFAFTYGISSCFFLQKLAIPLIVLNGILSFVSLILFIGLFLIKDGFAFATFLMFWIFAMFHLTLSILNYCDGRNPQKYLDGTLELVAAFIGILFGTVGFNYMYRLDSAKRLHQIIPIAAVSSTSK